MMNLTSSLWLTFHTWTPEKWGIWQWRTIWAVRNLVTNQFGLFFRHCPQQPTWFKDPASYLEAGNAFRESKPCFLRQGVPMPFRLALTSWKPSCLSLPSGITGMRHHSQLRIMFLLCFKTGLRKTQFIQTVSPVLENKNRISPWLLNLKSSLSNKTIFSKNKNINK